MEDRDHKISAEQREEIAEKAAERRSRGTKSDFIVIAILLAVLIIVFFTLERYI